MRQSTSGHRSVVRAIPSPRAPVLPRWRGGPGLAQSSWNVEIPLGLPTRPSGNPPLPRPAPTPLPPRSNGFLSPRTDAQADPTTEATTHGDHRRKQPSATPPPRPRPVPLRAGSSHPTPAGSSVHPPRRRHLTGRAERRSIHPAVVQSRHLLLVSALQLPCLPG